MRKSIPSKVVSQKEIDEAFNDLPVKVPQELENTTPRTFNMGYYSNNDLRELKDKYEYYVSPHFSYTALYDMNNITPTELKYLNRPALINSQARTDDIEAEVLRRQAIIKKKNPGAYEKKHIMIEMMFQDQLIKFLISMQMQ